jgi:hypothetical protein
MQNFQRPPRIGRIFFSEPSMGAYLLVKVLAKGKGHREVDEIGEFLMEFAPSRTIRASFDVYSSPFLLSFSLKVLENQFF